VHDGGSRQRKVVARIDLLQISGSGEPPSWIWIGLFSLVILYVKLHQRLGNLGTFEYWLSMVKVVVTIVCFLDLGSRTAIRRGISEGRLCKLHDHMAVFFFRMGGKLGVGLGVIFGDFFSFFGIEVVGKHSR